MMFTKKLKSAAGILAHIRHNIPPENYKTLYFALFESHLSYCITVFDNANKQYTGKLFVIQKHCIRIFFGDYKAFVSKFKTCALCPYSTHRKSNFGQELLHEGAHKTFIF